LPTLDYLAHRRWETLMALLGRVVSGPETLSGE